MPEGTCSVLLPALRSRKGTSATDFRDMFMDFRHGSTAAAAGGAGLFSNELMGTPQACAAWPPCKAILGGIPATGGQTLSGVLGWVPASPWLSLLERQ